MITGLHHVSMKCGTLEEYVKARTFYRDILGLPVKREWSEGIMFDTGEGIVEVFNNGDGIKSKGAIQHFAFVTNDVDTCIERVRLAGYRITTEPKDVVLDSVPPYPLRIAFCEGPLGEEIEILMEK